MYELQDKIVAKLNELVTEANSEDVTLIDALNRVLSVTSNFIINTAR